MKKTLMIVGVALLGQAVMGNAANAATDMTAYFKPMLAGCSYPAMGDGIPAKYKAAVANKKVKGNPKVEGEDVITTYTFKNATAFGQPLLKAEYLQGYEWGHMKLYFKNASFTNLRSQFKPPKAEEGFTLYKNNPQGYDYSADGTIYTVLTLDKKERSIMCSSGV